MLRHHRPKTPSHARLAGRGAGSSRRGRENDRAANILRHLGQSGPPDRELVTSYLVQRDQSAFAELVRRHGPVVFGVCRRVTGNSEDAEDAFQAVFLVLARKAGTLGSPDFLGNWLYGVAVRVAQKARRSAARRRAR